MYILCYMIGVPPFGVISLRNSLNSTYGTPLVLYPSIVALVVPQRHVCNHVPVP
jgi:hypothetical protein